MLMSHNVLFLTIARYLYPCYEEEVQPYWKTDSKPIIYTVDPITIQAKCINPPVTLFEKFDFIRSDWINLSQSLKFTNWIHELDQVSPDEFLPVAMNILISKCSIHVPLKRPKEGRKSKCQNERGILLRKRTQLS